MGGAPSISQRRDDIPNLPDPSRSAAILIGVSQYADEDLPDLPAAADNIRGLRNALTDPLFGAFASVNSVALVNPTDAAVIGGAFRAAAGAVDTLLVYYAGHALVSAQGNELYLGFSETDPRKIASTALPYETISEMLAQSSARNRVLILDCCYNGLAIQPALAGAAAAFGRKAPAIDAYVLTSFSDYARYSAFTTELT